MLRSVGVDYVKNINTRKPTYEYVSTLRYINFDKKYTTKKPDTIYKTLHYKCCWISNNKLWR